MALKSKQNNMTSAWHVLLKHSKSPGLAKLLHCLAYSSVSIQLSDRAYAS